VLVIGAMEKKLKQQNNYLGNMNSFGGLWNNQQCFDYEMRNGIHLDNPSFVNMYEDVVNEITTLLDIKTHTDLGGGVGAYCLAMKKKGIKTIYYDLNEHHYEYAHERNVADEYHICDFTTKKIKADFVSCIEVMEHIEDDKLKPFLANLKCNYFHFSSTPHYSNFDKEWGHINIKPVAHWVHLFEQCGFTLLLEMSKPTKWSLLFKKDVV
jgi:2-polyprenyl-3-methyl-5-hydroxy-6-metoxy-1,4-benzoquinol methylase